MAFSLRERFAWNWGGSQASDLNSTDHTTRIRRRAKYGFGEHGFKHRAHRAPGRELSEFLSAYYLCDKENSPSFSQNSPSLPQNSVRLRLQVYPYPMVWPLPRPWSETMVSNPPLSTESPRNKGFSGSGAPSFGFGLADPAPKGYG